MDDAETQNLLITELAALDSQVAADVLADPEKRENLFLDLAIEALHKARACNEDAARWLKLSDLYVELANDGDVGLPSVYL